MVSQQNYYEKSYLYIFTKHPDGTGVIFTRNFLLEYMCRILRVIVWGQCSWFGLSVTTVDDIVLTTAIDKLLDNPHGKYT